MSVNKILLTVLVVLIIAGLSMEANAGVADGGNRVEYNITCTVLAVASEQEDKATYYSSLIPDNVDIVLFEKIVRSVSKDIYKYAEKQGLSPKRVAGFGFVNYGCNRAFI